MTFPGFNSQNSVHRLDKRKINTQPYDCEPTRTTSETPQYVFAVGRLEFDSASVDIEKEWWQTLFWGGPGRPIPPEHHIKNNYLTRQMCWILQIDEIYTYILQPRNHNVMLQLLNQWTALNFANEETILIVGTLGEIAAPCMCNGLELPIVHVDYVEYLHTFSKSYQSLKKGEEHQQNLQIEYENNLDAAQGTVMEAQQRLATAEENLQARIQEANENPDDAALDRRIRAARGQVTQATNRLTEAQQALTDVQQTAPSPSTYGEERLEVIESRLIGDKTVPESALDLFESLRQKNINIGQTGKNRALNYVLVRELGIYEFINQKVAYNDTAQDNTAYDFTGISVEESVKGSRRDFYDVIFSLRDKGDGLTDKFYIRVDVTGKWPFRVSETVEAPPSPYLGQRFE
jgi:hypothetical protein